MSQYSVTLTSPAPWGFRLQGGKDFNMPLAISRLNDGGKATKAGVAVGDLVLSIDGISTDGMNHLEAQNKIKNCSGDLSLNLQKASSGPKPPAVAPKVKKTKYKYPEYAGQRGVSTCLRDVCMLLFHTIQDDTSSIVRPVALLTQPLPPPPHPPQHSPGPPAGGPPYPRPPRDNGSPPFIPSPTSAFTPAGSASAPQPSVYNTPIHLYSPENACEVAMGQRRGLLESQGGALANGGPQSILKKRQAPSAPRKHIVETDIHFYHVPTHADASRKRIMEDTEDWRPRTGTTQSRSFKILAQITGTENPQPEETEAAKKTRESKSATRLLVGPKYHELRDWHHGVSARTLNVHDEGAEPAVDSHDFAVIKTMVKGPAQGRGGQTALVTPSFGIKGNSGAPRGPAPSRPLPQPHPKDQDTLVQMAEHYPAGTRTPMCGHCNMVIRGPFLVAMGRSWHKEEFNCAHCRSSLADIGFVEEQGRVYCEHCYEEFLAPTCSRCRAKIMGEVINALKQTWHVHCFLCACCQQPIRNNTFHLEDGEPYCEPDFYSLFGTGCHGCEFPIEAGDRFLEALGHTWHDTCFACAVCCASLEGQKFFSKKDKPLCKKHANTFKI
ncbi:PDZ and LIM domain protein 5-like [Eucyclogobius newberryi]|uniref:PDZ and LIM domain protein 5-like n=1 Tax=Eucyclogobius newberryi TaxID=166745 RepID=UPI003B593D9F